MEDGVERVVVLAVAVTEQEAQGRHPVSELGGEGPGLLHGPCLCGVGGDAGDVQAPGAVFKERQCVQTCAEHGVDVEEIRRDDALGLGGEELAPGRAAAACYRVNARVMQDLPDGRVVDVMAESGQFTLDSPMTHRGFSPASRSTSDLIAARVGGRPVRRRAE
ncbi:hypothetical protein [Saccharothrix sp. NRRL B-16348]|uniref:hypothetical protein n=1 Tax=Saccharothrix sp. NRRL B-16348 TaxID=1415542 RepID=UPI0018D0FDF6|nr:hypothetical protein [Saccharothrix sp. NRRL B-16348]